MYLRSIPLLVCFLLLSSTAWAQPVISDLNLRGLQIGVSTQLNLSGQGLKKGSRVVMPFSLEQATVSENGNNSLQVKLTVPENVKPGLYPLRVFNQDGLSESVLIGIDRLPQREFDSQPQKLPVALTGNVAGARILKTSFVARKDELVVIEVESNRLGGKLKPVVHLYDERGKQVAFAQRSRFLLGDSRCFVRIPKEGNYFLELHDVLFRAAAPGYFRLKIGDFDYADLALPLAVKRNQKTAVRMIKIGAQSEFLEEVEMKSNGWQEPEISQQMFTGRVPQLLASEIDEFVEVAQSDKPVAAGSAPLGISGRISKAGEVDQFLVDVKPNAKLNFDLLGRRVGSPIDARIRIANPAGNTLAQNDDRPGAQDALLNFNVPGNVNQILVEVSDVSSQGSLSHVYRLGITEQSQPQVSVMTPRSTYNISKAGTVYVPIQVTRTNYSGPIEIVANGLPKNVEINGTTIPAGFDQGLLTFSTAKTDPILITLDALIQVGEQKVAFNVLGPETSTAQGNDAKRKQIALSTVESRNLNLVWKNVNQNLTGYLGGTLPTEVALTSGGDVKGPVRVRLVSNQKMPKKRIRKDNKDTFVDDIENSIRATPVEIANGNGSSRLDLLVPNEIAEGEWEMLLVAEWLTPDKKNVLFSSSTRPVKLVTQRLATVDLKEGKSLTLPKTGVAKYVVAGSIKRTGKPFPCRISLAGLPNGVSVPAMKVEADKSDFSVTFDLPVNPEVLKLKSLNVDFSFIDEANENRVVGKAKTEKAKIKTAAEPAP